MVRWGSTHTFAAPLMGALAVLLIAAQPAAAKPSVSATYAQVSSRTLSVFALVAGAPKGARMVVETRRFS